MNSKDGLSIEFESALHSLLKAKQLVKDGKLNNDQYLSQSSAFIDLFSNSSNPNEQVIVLGEKESQQQNFSLSRETQMEEYPLKEGKIKGWTLELWPIEEEEKEEDSDLENHDYMGFLTYTIGKGRDAVEVKISSILYDPGYSDVNHTRLRWSFSLSKAVKEEILNVFKDLEKGKEANVILNPEFSLLVHKGSDKKGYAILYYKRKMLINPIKISTYSNGQLVIEPRGDRNVNADLIEMLLRMFKQ